MPENPNLDPEAGSEYIIENYVTMATNINNMNNNGTTNNNNNNNNNKKASVPRIPSAGLKYYDIATQLLGKAGSDIEELFIAAARDGVYERIENFLQRNRSDAIVSIDVKDKKTGNTPLIWAAKRGHAKIVQLLLRHGADITLRNYEGHTAVEVASPSIRSILLDSVERQSEAHHLLLLQAAWQGDIKVVSRLLNQKKVIDVNCKNADGFTPVMLATRDIHLFEKLSTQMSRPYNPVEVVAELLSSRADVHATDSDGKTCLHHACQSKAVIAHNVVSKIISGGSELENKDKRCFTPIHCASLTGNAECITTLLDGGSEVNSRGFAGATPLHITSYNNHERATAVLLEYGADVSIQDDRGLTALDLARSRKMKKKLQEAWSEVMNNKSTTNLGPIRAPSREDVRTSIEDLTNKRKKGEVIFDGLPANPFTDANKKDSSTTIATSHKGSALRRTASLRDLRSVRIDTLLDTWAPLNSLPRNMKGNKGITRHLSLKEKASKTEELENGSQLLSQFPKDGPRRLGQVRSMRPTPLPRTKSRSTERLPAISPDRVSMPDRNLESPVHFNRNSRVRRSFEDKKGRGRRVATLSTREGSNIGDDIFDKMNVMAPSPTPSVRHRRSDSDPNRGTPNLLDIAASCDPYLQMQRRGRSFSMTSNIPVDGLDTNRQTPIQREMTITSVQREATLMSVCSVRSDSRMSTNSNHSPRLLNLGQMLSNSRTPVQNAPLYGPSSSKVIPPTPTFITQRSTSRKNSESDNSPRSEEDADVYKGVLENPTELIRTHTLFKEEFVLEESRPKDPSSLSSSVTPSDSGSSGGSSHLSSPRETPLLKTTKVAKSPRKTDKISAQVYMNKESGSKQNVLSGSVSVTKYKLNNKPVVPGKSERKDKVGGDKNSVPAKGEDITVPNVNDKGTSSVQATTVRNGVNANKNSDSQFSSKTEGTIIVQGDNSKLMISGSGKETSGSASGEIKHDSDKRVLSDMKTDTSGIAQSNFTNISSNSSIKGKTSSRDGKSAVGSNTKTFTSRNKQMLHVVPTKLTENIIQSSNKDSKSGDKNSTAKIHTDASDKQAVTDRKTDTISDTNETQLKAANQRADDKTNMTKNNSNASDSELKEQTAIKTELSGNNQVDKRQETLPKKIAAGPSDQCVQTENKSDSGKKIVSVIPRGNKTGKSINQSNSNRIVQQSASAQLNTRQGAQSRNSNMTKARSAGPINRPVSMAKKEPTVPTISKTPRGASSLQKPPTVEKSEKTNLQTSDSASCKDKINQSKNGCQKSPDVIENKTVKSSSPTDLVPTAVCRSASMSKSYNMSSVSNTVRSAGNTPGTLTSVSAASKSQENASDKKNSGVSKSSSEVLVGSGKLVNTSNIVSKSISQLTNVGAVPKETASAKGLLRSSSMSTIEESKEKNGNSADTKTGATEASKKRPASDGPAGLTSNHDHLASKANAPLIDILPDRGTSTKLNAKPFVNQDIQMTTPVIVNPFEELEQKREEENLLKLGKYVTATDFGFIVEKPGVERSKTQTSVKSKTAKNSKRGRDKPNSASSRASSGRRRRARSKDSSANKSDGESARPKSGKSSKRCKSGKRKRKIPEGSLAKANEKSDVALIGGIGWHLETSCIDKSNVDAVIVSQFDSSESESEDIKNVEFSPPHLIIPEPQFLQTNNPLESPSMVSPRFKEIRPVLDDRQELPIAVNDGYPPMNLDMTQSSLCSKQGENRAGVYVGQNLPDDINAFLSKIQEQESHEFDDIEDDDDDDDDDDDYMSDEYDESLVNALHRDMLMGKLTPIPESPAQTHTGTPSTLHHVARTMKAITNFDANLKEDDLNLLLGATPRDNNSVIIKDHQAQNSANSMKSKPHSHSAGAAKLQQKKDIKQGSSASNVSRVTSTKLSTNPIKVSPSASKLPSNTAKVSSATAGSRASKTSQGGVAINSDRNASSSSKQSSAVSSRSSLKNVSTANTIQNSISNSQGERSQSRSGKKYEVNEIPEDNENKQTVSEKLAAEKGNTVGSNLKNLLAEKMQGIQRLLEESNSASRARAAARRKHDSQGSDNFERESTRGDKTPTNNDKEIGLGNINDDIVIDLSNRGLETERTDEDIVSTRSSRKERKFSETKTTLPDDEIKEAMEEIFSNTFPSVRSNHRSGNASLNSSLKSRNSTLTEADRNVLAQMVKENQASPFHAKENSVRVSSSYDESGTLNKDNPDLLRRFHPDKFHLGQKVKAMIDAGADSAKVRQMMKSDNETQQLAKIMNSFRQMELYAGPHGTNNRSSSKKETPRKDGEVARSFSHHAKTSSVQKGLVPRPGSAGAGRIRTGKFTEIKENSSSTSIADKPKSAVPKKLAEEFERSPFKQVGPVNSLDQFKQLEKAVTAGSSDSDEEEKINLLDDTLESRPDSACTTLSSHSSIFEETIQWKKGNVLGKGAFGTVWCGLTSEGQLIAVKQIELNTNNHHKAKKEYEKVQEEVELLKTLEHKNIVGYLGTSLEDSIVSIFMQFVPGGSIASILARFGALDEAVFRKYTKQILEGVDYLHKNDVIHRDIKGGNVMLMPNGVIKLIDFGCAKRLCINLSMGQSEILKSMKGTPYWMAPEVVNETGHGKKSDIWSIGCTVFEMATRKPPWAEMNPMAAIFAIGSNKPVPQLPDRFSDDAREFVNFCLTKDQTKRLTASELLQLPFIKRKSRKLSSNC